MVLCRRGVTNGIRQFEHLRLQPTIIRNTAIDVINITAACYTNARRRRVIMMLRS